jgi:O-methyltransferase involved in polyketide biosynthesis
MFMPDISVANLNHVSETLLIPLYCRAEESHQPQPILRDDKAVRMVRQINYDFSKFDGQKLQVVTAAMRAREFDRAAKEFLAIHPTGVVVNLGCGLDARSERADNGEARWLDLDFPEVIAVRRQFFSESERHRMLAASALGEEWLAEVGGLAPGPFLFLAEGVFMYLTAAEVRALVLKLQAHFPGARLCFDACSTWMAKRSRKHPMVKHTNAEFKWGLDDSHELERWDAGIRLEREWFYTSQKEKRLGLFRLLRFIPAIVKSFRIVHYRLS